MTKFITMTALTLVLASPAFAGGIDFGNTTNNYGGQGGTAISGASATSIAAAAAAARARANATGGNAASTATGGAAAGGFASSNGADGNVVNIDPPIYAPTVALGSPTAPCKVPAGISLGFGGGAVGAGWATEDSKCTGREGARMLWNMGYHDQAMYLLEQSDENIAKAFQQVPDRRAEVPAPVAAATGVGQFVSTPIAMASAAPAPAPVYACGAYGKELCTH